MTRERGSALMLVPATVLVLVVLAAIVIDSAVVFLGQRELDGATAAAANDAAGAAVDDASFYGEGAVVLDPARAENVARIALEARAPRGLEVHVLRVVVDGRQVTVSAEARVDHVVARRLPGVRPWTAVRASSTAVAEER